MKVRVRQPFLLSSDSGSDCSSVFSFGSALLRPGSDVGVEAAVEGVTAERGGVAYQDKLHACARHGYIHASQIPEEAYLAVFVAAYQRHDDDVALLSLKAVNGVDGDEVSIGLEPRGISEQTP